MKQTGLKGGGTASAIRATVALVIALFVSSIAYADEDLYRRLSMAAKGTGDLTLIKKLNEASRKLDWKNAAETEFEGHLRLLKASAATVTGDETSVFLVRSIKGELFILAVPSKETLEREGATSKYASLEKMLEDKLTFKIQSIKGTVDGKTYLFAHFVEKPKQLALDRIFKVSIVLMLFFVMLGMGLTLTMKDFKIVFQKPKGMLTGAVLQWAVMPLVAVGLGRMLGFYDAYPFVFVGMVLIAVSPGGVTSNLMTYYAKGDLALSISLTSFSTVLSLVFTPLLLTLYCANVPEVNIPVKMVIQTIIILVIIPLAVGMSVRNRWPNFATKATPFFSALGVIALLFLIGAGLLGNLDMFADTERYGFAFYTMVFVLTLSGMLLGALIPKLIGINNYQTRAISLETGLRNASLAMALALLIQDYMGDFYSSMFFTSAIFGLWMYVAGFLSIAIYKKLLPIPPKPDFEFPVEDGEY
ncbi:MAG: bile acid:sodium symporter family protein [Spirochaetes bacterium]|jgi:BASS family bile acid:Na+ symporter|nr:bile acid:sodium symporter family protein [Spirochaetota bacterium]